MTPVTPQTLQREIAGHQPRYDDVFQRSQQAVRGDAPAAQLTRARLDQLRSLWQRMREETERRHGRLEEARHAQQYLFDAAEAEAWMSEQELYMMSEEKAKVGRGPGHLTGSERAKVGGARDT